MAQGTGLKIYPAYEVLEKVDAAEWAALTNTNKAVLQLIISAGICYFSDNSVAKAHLFDIFPVGTTTGDALRLL